MQTVPTPAMWAPTCRTRQPKSLCPGWKQGEEEESKKLQSAKERDTFYLTPWKQRARDTERDSAGPARSSFSIMSCFIKNCVVLSLNRANKSLLKRSTVTEHWSGLVCCLTLESVLYATWLMHSDPYQMIHNYWHQSFNINAKTLST